MNKKFLICWLFIASVIYPAGSQDVLDINQIRAQINYEGSLFKKLTSMTAGFEVPKGSNKHTIYTSALWIGGFDAGNNLYEAAQTYRQTGTDFWAGPLDTMTLATDTAGWQRNWKVNRRVIDYHKSNWNVSGYVIPDEIKNWPGNGKGAQMNRLAPFADINSNGSYDPENGDYPLIYGDQAVYFLINDTFSRHEETRAFALGIEVHGMAYAFDSTRFGDSLNTTVFLHLEIMNLSGRDYHDLYSAIWTDFDIGYPSDDFIACDTVNNLYYGYNGDSLDEGIIGYGLNPPFQAVKFLNHKMTHFIKYNNDFGPAGNPFLDIHYYNYMQGKWLNGQSIRYGGDGYNNVWKDRKAYFMFPDDPRDTFPGWSERTCNNTPGDRRGLGSVGPYSFKSKEKIVIDVAYIYSESKSQNYLNSVDDIFEKSKFIQGLYDKGKLTNPDYLSVNTEQGKLEIKIYPNPMENQSIISFPGTRQQLFNLKITDLSGKTILLKNNLRAEQMILTRDQLPSGFYIITLESDGISGQEKLIVR